MNTVIKEITKSQELEGRDHFKVGDGIKVHLRIKEGDKERIQIFAGIIIAFKGSGIQSTITVRRVQGQYGVERIFHIHSPSIEKIEVVRDSIRRRAKIYHMRKAIGKRANEVKEKRLLNK